MTQTADGEDNRDVTLTASQANKEVTLAFTTSNLKSIFILATQDVKLYTNHASGSNPDDTIQLKANVPFTWQTGTGIPVPFAGNSGDITKIYLTNDAASAADVQIRMLKDATP